MRLVVFSYKPCWRSDRSPSGYATDGGFPFQMQALSELFDSTTLVVPCDHRGSREGEVPLVGHRLSIVPLTPPRGRNLRRKIGLPIWLLRNGHILIREALRADAVHTPIPGDIGTLGMMLAWILREPLFVRHCGNWLAPKSVAEHFWKWFMERFAGGRNVMLATGGTPHPPSRRNPNVRWIFATSLTEEELKTSRRLREEPPGADPRLIIVCRQDEEKGTAIVIQSLPIIMNDFPETRLDVIGGGLDLGRFKALAQDLNLGDRVHFHGRVDHRRVIELLHQADLFCYPTRASEGFPKVVLEALACGLPVITTPVSVLPQLIETGCGVLLDEATPEALADAVRLCLSDPERYRSMSARALETAGQYSLERWRDTIGEILEEAWGPLKSNG